MASDRRSASIAPALTLLAVAAALPAHAQETAPSTPSSVEQDPCPRVEPVDPREELPREQEAREHEEEKHAGPAEPRSREPAHPSGGKKIDPRVAGVRREDQEHGEAAQTIQGLESLHT